MNLRPLSLLGLALVSAGSALGCDPRGVSLGTEELCVADADLELAQATSTEHVSTCARIGENQLVNASFEAPLITCHDGTYCHFPAAEVEGWQTTSTTRLIEIWHDGYIGVPAPEGSQFVELDATSQDTLSQEVASVPGQLMYWSLLHRGRIERETVELRIGPPQATVSQAVLTSATDAWYPYSGLYRTGDAETVTRFELVSRTGLAEGNLIDAVVFAPVD
jgi:hypothetical protein